MKKTDSLRERAEKKVKKLKKEVNVPETSFEQVHELQVHQAELEMQNEELRKAQEELAVLYSQYHELYDAAPVGYFSVDEDLIIRNVNIKGAELLGLNKNQIMGWGFSRFIPANYQNIYYNNLIEVTSSGGINDVELQLKRNGTLFYADMKIMPLNGKDYRIIITDISKRKKAEEELREAHSNLKEKVEEQTVELKDAINALERSNEELQQFAYVASHDLQEPLRTIASFTQLLEKRYKGKFDSDADEFMDFIVDAAVRMKEQIEGLLEYSRIATKAGKFETVNINEIVNQTIKLLDTSIKEANAEVTYDKLPDVNGDAKQLQRVFQNLISNAIRFRKCEEPLQVHLSSYKSENGEEYVFSVQDNGIGIEEQYSERIFTIFQRLHTRDEYQGTGIGLSIVKRIIERHGGHIWVDSSLGKGSTFHFTIPVEPVHMGGGDNS